MTIAPIWWGYRDAENCLRARFDFGMGVFTGPSTEWPLAAEDVDHLSQIDGQVVRASAFSFAAEYENGSETDKDWRGSKPRTKQEAALYRIRIANIALWLARPTDIGFTAVIHKCEIPTLGFKRAGSHTSPFLRIVPRERYLRQPLKPGDLDKARGLYRTILDLRQQGSVWVAIFTPFSALTEESWIIRFPLIWIGLEALQDRVTAG